MLLFANSVVETITQALNDEQPNADTSTSFDTALKGKIPPHPCHHWKDWRGPLASQAQETWKETHLDF